MEIQTRKWCQTIWLVKPLQRMRTLTYLVMIWPWSDFDLTWGQVKVRSRCAHRPTWSWSDLDLTLTWPDVKFSKWHFNVKSARFEPARRGKQDGIIFIFVSLISKKVINEKSSPWKTTIFHLMTSGAKIIDIRSNLIEERSRGIRRASQHFFFELFLAIKLLRYGGCLRKNYYFIEIWPLVISGDLNINLT